MRVVFASDHAGFALKNKLVDFVRELGYDVDDLGAHEQDPGDDYPPIIARAAREVSQDPENTRGIVLGGSGQGEAIVANRFPNVRAVVYYGEGGKQKDTEGDKLEMIRLTREHNNTNVLSFGARFLDEEEAKETVKLWLALPFPEEERHTRRVNEIERYS